MSIDLSIDTKRMVINKDPMRLLFILRVQTDPNGF